jgi:hypothetical protein
VAGAARRPDSAPMIDGPYWCCARAAPCREDYAVAALAQRGFVTYIPQTAIRCRRRGGPREIVVLGSFEVKN